MCVFMWRYMQHTGECWVTFGAMRQNETAGCCLYCCVLLCVRHTPALSTMCSKGPKGLPDARAVKTAVQFIARSL